LKEYNIRKKKSEKLKKKKSRQNPRRSVPAGLDAIPKMGFLSFSVKVKKKKKKNRTGERD
jgi:hypothetical protein